MTISGQFILMGLMMETAVLNVACFWIKMQDTADAAVLSPNYLVFLNPWYEDLKIMEDTLISL